MWLFAPQPLQFEIILEAQCTREVKLWQIRYEIGEKSSKIVPLGVPLLTNVYTASVSFNALTRLAKKV
jgi:hypothetical protein